MNKPTMLLLGLAVAGLGVYTSLPDGGETPGEARPENATPGEGGSRPEPAPRRSARVRRLASLPDTSQWERHRTQGGMFDFPVPPGWCRLDTPDPQDMGRIKSGFMVSRTLKDTRAGIFWFPFLPLYSSGSPEIKRLLEARRVKKPGMIIYERSDMKGLLTNLRWAYHPVCSPDKFITALQHPWFGRYFLNKCSCPRPEGFSLTGVTRITSELSVCRLAFKLGLPGKYQDVEGLCWLATSRPVPGRGGWGVWMLFVQVPKGEWDKYMPTLWAILANTKYDHQAHLAVVGERRIDEVALLRRAFGKIAREDLQQRWQDTATL